jgi:MFS family permease
VLLQIFQQATGVNIILVFNSSFDAPRAAFEESLPWLLQALAVVGGALVIEWIGRRAVLTGSLAVTALTDVAFAVVSAAGADAHWAKYAVVCVFMVGYGLGIGPIPLFYVAERFPQPLRAYALSLILCINWAGAFGMVRLCAAFQAELSGWVAFAVFACASAGGALFAFFCVRNPEAQARRAQILYERGELIPESAGTQCQGSRQRSAG